MLSVSDRIQLKMKQKGCKQVDLVKATGAKKGTVSKWVSGTNTPRGQFILKLAEFLETDVGWLLTGESKENSSKENSMNAVVEWDYDSPLEDSEFEIPHYDAVTEGMDKKDGKVQIITDKKIRMDKALAERSGASKGMSFSYINDGNAMADRISNGARCTADSSKTEIKDGKIYCFKHGVIRRTRYLFLRPDGGLLIRSHNPDYEDEIVAPEDRVDIEILGWVWEWSNTETW